MRLPTTNMAFLCGAFCSYVKAAAGAPPSPSDEPGHVPLGSNITPGGQWGQGDEDIDVRHGVLFQTNGCPQAITAAEAPDIATTAAIFPGNTIHLTTQTTGRTGNRYEDMSQYLSMAYCCRSTLFVLPEHVLPEEERPMPTEEGSTGEITYRSYNFSDARMDLLPEFTELSDRPDVCLPKRVASGLDAYNLVGVHPDLQLCLNHVFVRGCEAELMGSTVNTTALCRPTSDQRETITAEDIHIEDITAQDTTTEENNTEDNHQQQRPRNSKPGVDILRKPTALDRKTQDTRTGTSQSAGSLVIHIRSGDIFKGKGDSGFGQPPLEFFLDAIASKGWSDVSITTYSEDPGALNPTYKALGLLNSAGMLGPNVDLHHDRPLLEDIKAMLCADALAVSRSSLHFLTFVHTRASTFYLPGSCGPGRYTRRSRVGSGPPTKKTPDNATFLLVEKPWAEVYGIEWEGNRSSYTPYDEWTDTDAQLLEMVTFDGVKGLKRCSIND